MKEIKEIIENNRNILNRLFSENPKLQNIRKSLFNHLKFGDIYKDNYIVVTGHQPIFYYPGIMIKDYYIHTLSKNINCIPVNFIVDTDRANISVPVPVKKDGVLSKKIVQLDNPNENCYVSWYPSEKDVKNFFVTIEKKLKTLGKKDILRSFRNYMRDFMYYFSKNRDFISTIVLLREKFEKENNFPVLDIRVSNLAQTSSFYHFFLMIIQHIDEFVDIYNQGIKKNIKYKKGVYQTLKLLERKGDLIELPFWYVTTKRNNLSIRKRGTSYTFVTNDKKIFEIDINSIDDNRIINTLKKKLPIFPKAAMLTFFIRVFFADLFVHGKGGAVYDKITDYVIRKFFKLESDIKYVTVSADIYLPLGVDFTEISRKYKEKSKWLKEIKYHPEKFLDKNLAEIFMNKKKSLLERLKNEKDSTIKKKIHAEIDNLHQDMLKYFKKNIAVVEEEISYYEEIINTKDVYLERRYPYFFYPKNLVEILEQECEGILKT